MPLPRLRARISCAQVQPFGLLLILRCNTPLLSVQTLSASYRLFSPPRAESVVRTFQSYPLKRSGTVGRSGRDPTPFTVFNATTEPPIVGATSIVGAG